MWFTGVSKLYRWLSDICRLISVGDIVYHLLLSFSSGHNMLLSSDLSAKSMISVRINLISQFYRFYSSGRNHSWWNNYLNINSGWLLKFAWWFKENFNKKKKQKLTVLHCHWNQFCPCFWSVSAHTCLHACVCEFMWVCNLRGRNVASTLGQRSAGSSQDYGDCCMCGWDITWEHKRQKGDGMRRNEENTRGETLPDWGGN